MTEVKNGEDTVAVTTEEKPDVEDITADAEVVDPSQQVFKNLVILPPLQKDAKIADRNGNSAANHGLNDAVPLPPIRAEEPVSSIRAALGEVRGYAHLTNYRFVLENSRLDTNENDGTKSTAPYPPKGPGPVASPYTGMNAVISTKEVINSFLNEAELANGNTENVSAAGAKEDNVVLDEYGDLTSLLGDADGEVLDGLKDGSGFRIVLERYDVVLIRDHIARLRTLLDGNAPISSSLDEGSTSGDAAEPPASPPTTASDKENHPVTEKDGKVAKTAEGGQSATEETQSNSKEEQQKTSNQKQKKDAPSAPPKDMPVFPAEKALSPDVNSLKQFFYYACGEDPSLYLDDSDDTKKETVGSSKSKKKGKKKNPKTALAVSGDKTNVETEPKHQLIKRIIPELNAIEERTRVPFDALFSGFHPPPQYRQFMGDLAYLEVTLPDGELVSISATPIGFFVNRSSLTRGDYKFDPSPAEKPCYSHELLDCLLQYSKSFSEAWNDALAAAKTRAELMFKINEDGPFQSFFRVAIRGDFPGYKKASVAAASEGIDALVQIPSWLVPIPQVELEANNAWNRNCEHVYSSASTEADLSNSFGVDIRNGSLRDWNEELQVAREMPMDNLLERIERARYVVYAHSLEISWKTPVFSCSTVRFDCCLRGGI